jgi:DNA-binding response OmpR family regulator
MTVDAPHILVLEDDPETLRFIRRTVEAGGYRVSAFPDRQRGLAFLAEDCPDALLLDLGLLDGDGSELLAGLRLHDLSLPVLVVSGQDDRANVLRCFDLGCDDFIAKPFDADELLARLKRFFRKKAPTDRSRPRRYGPFELDPDTATVTKNGRALKLRFKLFNILLYLAERSGSLVSKEELLARFWERVDEYTADSLYVHVRQLRALIEDDPDKPRYLRTVRNRGLVFSCAEDAAAGSTSRPGPSESADSV